MGDDRRDVGVVVTAAVDPVAPAFRQALDQVDHGIWIARRVDTEALVYVNDALCQLLGVTSEDALSKPWHYWIPNTASQAKELQAGALASQKTSVQLTRVLPSGQRQRLHVVLSMLAGEGHGEFCMGTVKQLAVEAARQEQQQQQQQRQQQQQQGYDLLGLISAGASAVQHGVVLLEVAASALLPLRITAASAAAGDEPDPTLGKVLFANPAMELMTGHTSGELTSRGMGMLIGPDTSAAHVAALRGAFKADRAVCLEILFYHKSGRPYWEEITVSPCAPGTAAAAVAVLGGAVTPGVPDLPAPGSRRFVVLHRDVTARKRAEVGSLLRDHALDSLSEGITIVGPDPEGRITYVNEAFCRLTGYSPAECVGRNCRFLQGPDTDREAVDVIRAAVSAQRPVVVELLNYRRNGQPFWNHLSIMPVRDAAGRLVSFIGVQSDVTELIVRKAAESKLLEAKAAAENAMEAKSMFLANMSHEVRTPLNGMIATTQLLLASSLTPEQRDITETVLESGNALLGVLGDILDFSKIDHGSIVLQHEPVDLRAVTESCIEIVAAEASKKGLRLAYSIDDELADRLLMGDPTRIRQVLANLMSNAVKFTHRGEVVIDVRMERIMVPFSSTSSGTSPHPARPANACSDSSCTNLACQDATHAAAVAAVDHMMDSGCRSSSTGTGTRVAFDRANSGPHMGAYGRDSLDGGSGSGASLSDRQALSFERRGSKLEESGSGSGRSSVELSMQDVVHFSVRDTGIGISEEYSKKLFQCFCQGSESMSRRYGGTGLGLAISKRLAELMSGTIWVESVPGRGSTFHFTIQAALLARGELCPPPQAYAATVAAIAAAAAAVNGSAEGLGSLPGLTHLSKARVEALLMSVRSSRNSGGSSETGPDDEQLSLEQLVVQQLNLINANAPTHALPTSADHAAAAAAAAQAAAIAASAVHSIALGYGCSEVMPPPTINAISANHSAYRTGTATTAALPTARSQRAAAARAVEDGWSLASGPDNRSGPHARGSRVLSTGFGGGNTSRNGGALAAAALALTNSHSHLPADTLALMAAIGRKTPNGSVSTPSGSKHSGALFDKDHPLTGRAVLIDIPHASTAIQVFQSCQHLKMAPAMGSAALNAPAPVVLQRERQSPGSPHPGLNPNLAKSPVDDEVVATSAPMPAAAALSTASAAGNTEAADVNCTSADTSAPASGSHISTASDAAGTTTSPTATVAATHTQQGIAKVAAQALLLGAYPLGGYDVAIVGNERLPAALNAGWRGHPVVAVGHKGELPPALHPLVVAVGLPVRHSRLAAALVKATGMLHRRKPGMNTMEGATMSPAPIPMESLQVLKSWRMKKGTVPDGKDAVRRTSLDNSALDRMQHAHSSKQRGTSSVQQTFQGIPEATAVCEDIVNQDGRSTSLVPTSHAPSAPSTLAHKTQPAFMLRGDSAMTSLASCVAPVTSGMHATLPSTTGRSLGGSTSTAAATSTPVPSTLRILIAEDNKVNQKVVLKVLQQILTGCKPDVVENGLQVLRALEQKVYDIILMDIHMPEMDGLEASKRIRDAYPRPEERPRIIALSADTLLALHARCLEAGIEEFIVKPFRVEDLRRVMTKQQHRVMRYDANGQVATSPLSQSVMAL